MSIYRDLANGFEVDKLWQADFVKGSEELLHALWREHPAILRQLTGKLHGY